MPALTSSVMAESAYADPAHVVAEWVQIALPSQTPGWIIAAAGIATYLLFAYLTIKLVRRLLPVLAMTLVSAGNGVWAIHNSTEAWIRSGCQAIKRIVCTVLKWLLDRLSNQATQ